MFIDGWTEMGPKDEQGFQKSALRALLTYVPYSYPTLIPHPTEHTGSAKYPTLPID